MSKMNFLYILLMFTCIHIVDTGFIYDKGLGADCLYDEDCLTRNSFCKGNKVCACKIGYQYDAGSDVCFPREVNLKCNEDYDCSALQNAKCIYGVCVCKNDYVASKDKSTCLPSMKLTSICEEDSQCSAVMNRSFCNPVMRKCVCESGFRHDTYRMQCVRQSNLHSTCLITDDCEWTSDLKGKVECKRINLLSDTCECRDGFIESNDNCYSDGSSKSILYTSIIISLLAVHWML